MFTLFAEYPHINVVPGFPEPIEIDAVAPQYCANCGVSAAPVFDTNNDEWIMPCHYVKCADCGWWQSCEDVIWSYSKTDYFCTDCYVPRPEREYNYDCDCSSCNPRRRQNAMRPQWEIDGITLSDWHRDRLDQVSSLIETEASYINPQAMMAEFYVTDYVLATIRNTYRNGLSANNVGHAAAYSLRADAKTLQDSIVATCDGIFRDYLLMAIGGELRHHYGVAMPSGRQSSGAWFTAMAHQYGRIRMIADAVNLFGDHNGWDDGYGGTAWQKIALILLGREDGSIDARTFVDRVFTLQHNGGCCLNKIFWGMNIPGDKAGIGSMSTIGDAHASDIPDFKTLFRYCRPDVLRDFLFDVNGRVRFSSASMVKRDRRSWDDSIAIVAECLSLNWGDAEPIVSHCTGTVQFDGYVYHPIGCDDCPEHPRNKNGYYGKSSRTLAWFKS